MKFKNVLVTGGAGFIGSHITDKLINDGFNVTILDNLDDQVHQGKAPVYLNPKAKFIKGDVTSEEDLKLALENIEVIYHKAAVVGVGQSMYQIERYIFNNSYGTAKLLNFLANNKHKVKRLIVASSMSAYGEGLYNCPKCGLVRPNLREDLQMNQNDWELHCENCEMYITPIPISEKDSFKSTSIYAVSKQSQEDMVMIFGKSYGIPATALRYFNVYGPRQSLSNPYTGVAAIFLSRLKNDKPPIIYEDGLQSRDFVSVYDIADLNVSIMENEKSWGDVFNVGNGIPITIKGIARVLNKLLGKNIEPTITKEFRSGDVRHCFANVEKLKSKLGWSPKWNFTSGMEDLIKWGKDEAAEDLFNQANQELISKGLIKS